MKLALVITSLGLAFAASSQGATVTLQLDFGSSGSPATSGYTIVNANFLANTPTASVANINGLGYAFSIDNVGSYNSGTGTEPLTTDGFYTFGNDTLTHGFTLTGLSAGDQVSLYALAGWDGNGRGAQVSFGGSTTQAQIVGTPGTTPTLANFTLIGSDTVTGSGMLSGALFGAGHPGTADSEGQVGGFVFVITTSAIPEPASAGLLLGLAATTFAAIRRRRTRLAVR
jgi:hypothetical protein